MNKIILVGVMMLIMEGCTGLRVFPSSTSSSEHTTPTVAKKPHQKPHSVHEQDNVLIKNLMANE